MRKLRERLLRGGIAPASAERYLAELTDHFDDLVDEMIAAGCSPADARVAALDRLGDPDTLAQPMLFNPRFQSRACRHPVLAYLALPLVLQVAVVVVLATLLVIAGRNGLALEGIGAATSLLLLLAPLALGWSVAATALRRRARLVWPLLGMLVTLLVGAALRLHVGGDAVHVSMTAPVLPLMLSYGLLTIVPFLITDRLLKAF
jgi:hypothetical protein